MPNFADTTAPITDQLTTQAPKFIDREACVCDDGQFAPLSQALSDYWQAGGQEVLPLSKGDNQLLSADVVAKSKSAQNTAPLPDACVLVAISDEPVPRLLLTRRAVNLNSHAGEVSFVGGKRDDADVSSLSVACREAFEEVGLNQHHISLIGYLPMQMSRSGLFVRPVVASIEQSAMDGLIANQDEIDAIFWLNFEQILTPPVDYAMSRLVGTQRFTLHTPAWLGDDGAGEQVVWGLTARILANLAEIGYGQVYPWYYRLRV